jgi:hypothetical protein
MNRKPVSLLSKIALLLFWLACPLCLHADSISGTIADPSGFPKEVCIDSVILSRSAKVGLLSGVTFLGRC